MKAVRPTADEAPVLAPVGMRLPIAGRLNAVARLILRSALRVYPAAAGLSFVDAAVIGGLGGFGPMTASDLAQQLTMHEGHLSRALKSLEKAGLLARIRDPSDARRKMLMLTREGKALYRTVHAVQRAREAQLLDGIGDADRAAFFRTLAAIQKNAGAILSTSAEVPPESLP